MEKILKEINIEDFKKYFSRDFKYLNFWNDNIEYLKNDLVFYDNSFFICLQKNINKNPEEETEYWLLDETVKKEDFINDDDIEKAFFQAKSIINKNLLKNKELFKMCFFYLTAHFLIQDMSMSNGNGSSSHIITSKSVGSVSASYGIPQRILNSPFYSYLAKTDYGLKYLIEILPFLSGNFVVVQGSVNIW